MDKETLLKKIKDAQDQMDKGLCSFLDEKQMGYISAYEEMLAEVNGHTETASWMETICLHCELKFKLDYSNVILGHEEMAPHGMVPVITCPHCKKRSEF
jgi:hypothetical protein